MKAHKYYTNTRYETLEILNGLNFTNVLEVGGGDFLTLQIIKRNFNIVAHGIDPFSDCMNIDMHIKGFFDKPFDRNKLRDNYYDLIVANDVIEHILDTEEFFNGINDKLVSNGFLVLSVPNVRNIKFLYNIFLRGTFPRDDSGLFDSTHLRWFCKNDILSYARKHNLILVKHHYLGKFIPKILNQSCLFEIIALQNIFLLRKL